MSERRKDSDAENRRNQEELMDPEEEDHSTDASDEEEEDEEEQIPLLSFTSSPMVESAPMDTGSPATEIPSGSRPTSSGSDASSANSGFFLTRNPEDVAALEATRRQEETPGRVAQEGEVRVTVKALNDREIIIVIGQNETIQSLLNRARTALNMNTGTQKIIFSGRVLLGTSTIQEAGIQTGNTVHIVERSPGGHNDRPNITARFVGGPGIPSHEIPAMLRRISATHTMDGDQTQPGQAQTRIRVPCSLNGGTVLHTRFSEEVIEQKSLSLHMRGLTGQRAPAHQSTNVFMQDPNYILWKIKVNEESWLRPRQQIEQIVRQTLQELPFLPDMIKQSVTLKWDHRSSVLTIHFPEIMPHIASPALERMDFLAFWTEHLQYFIDKLLEHDGLVAAVRQVLEMTQKQQRVDDLSQADVEQRLNALDAIIRDFEEKWAGLSHMKDYERARFRKNQHNEDYRRLKIEEHSESQRNPRFYMRHALDTELHDIVRHFRQQQRRFSDLEDLLDDLNQAGAIKFIRDCMNTSVDYRYRALSMYFHYMQRMRHQMAHMTHLVSEIDVPFMNPGCPQRLLPQYSSNMLSVPVPYCGSLSFQFVTLPADGETTVIPTKEVLPPPRMLSDIANRVHGDWPYLPYHPPSIFVDSVRSQRGQPVRIRAVIPATHIPVPHGHVPHPPGHQGAIIAGPPVPVPGSGGMVGIPVLAPGAPMPAIPHPFVPAGPPHFHMPVMPDPSTITMSLPNDPFLGVNIGDMVQAQQEQLEALLNQSIPPIERPGPRVTNVPNQRHRRVLSTTNGDTPSVPIETQPPPGDAARRYTTGRFNVQPDARGADTETLAPFPVQIEPSELQRIAKNIASRYREDALRRIATMLSARFQDESWDTRLQNMPLCTLRECVAVALELLTSSGNTVDESRNLMLALVRDEEVLVRAVTECVKSLFGRGEFPTHVARLIMPREQAAGSRNDYESDHVEEGQSEELDGMVVRMPSDISQPQSGDLRAIRESRMRRRQLAENRAAAANSATPSTSTAGPSTSSFSPEDTADIRSGRLPLGRRRVRETVHPTPARAESPSQISVTFIATSQPFMHGQPPGVGVPQLGQYFMPPSQPGPSAGIPIPSAPPVTWPHSMDMFPQMRPVVSPTPTTRGLLDFDISEASDQVDEQNHPGLNTPSSEPAGPSTSSQGVLPRANSAPTTSNSSPTRQAQLRDPIQQILDEAARYTDYHLGMAGFVEGTGIPVTARAPATNLNGNLADTRRQHPFPGGATAQETNRSPQRRPDPKPIVAIDPFMTCTNRLCEINMLATTPTQESERLSQTSNRPDEDFMRHIQSLLPPIDRRPKQVNADEDPDYKYNLHKYANGELKFDNVPSFKKFIRTAIRSLMSHCIDSDTVHTMNMNPISGYPAACHMELIRMVRGHLSHRPPLTPAGEARARQQRALDELQRQQQNEIAAANQRAEHSVILANLNRPSIFSQFPNGAEMERELLTAGRIANFLLNVPEYMQNHDNPRPPGLFGLLLELTYQRLTAHDFAQMARQVTAQNVITEYAGVIQRHIRQNLLGGRQGLTNTELYERAALLANREEFFGQFLQRNPSFPTEFQFGEDPNDMLEVPWAMREVEIAFIKTLLTLATFHEHPRAIAAFVMKITNDYLYRNLVIFWRMAGRDMNDAHEKLKRVSTFFANIRFHQQRVTQTVYNAYADDWQCIIDRYFTCYSAFSEPEFNEFITKTRAGSDWNEIDCYVPLPRSVTPSTEVSDRTTPANSADVSSLASPRDLEASNSTLNSTVANNNTNLNVIWHQIRRFFQENAITRAVVTRFQTLWTWLSRR